MSNITEQFERTWKIVLLLSKEERYFSSNEIQDYLQNQGYKVGIRTVQRDLSDLSEVVPLECDKTDKPYSWRWKRLEGSKKHKLSEKQAIVFRMVELYVADFLSEDILDALEPLFIRSRLKLSNIDDSTFDEQTNKVITKNLTQLDLMQRINNRLHDIRMNKLFTSEKLNTKVEKETLEKLSERLIELNLHELNAEIVSFIQDNVK